MSAALFFFLWALGVPACLALVWLAVMIVTRLEQFLEHLYDAGWPFGLR